MGVFTRFSLRNPVVVILFTVIICIGGIISSLSLKEELMPDIAFPVLAVVTPYPGATPESVDRDVSTPLEDALRNVSGVQNVTSTSVQNVSEITLELTMNADLATVQQKVEQLIGQVNLPSGVMKPTVQQFSFNSSPVVNFTVASDGASNSVLRTVVNQTIVPALQGVPGVASVQTGGALAPRVNIQFDAAKLSAHNLTLQQVVQDLQASNVNMPLGSETVNGNVEGLQLKSPFTSLDSIKNIPIPIPTNPSAGLADIGKSMTALGKGVQSLGTAVGQVSQGMSGLSQGLGAVQGETQLLSALQAIQGQLFGAELQLAKLQALPQSQQNPQAIAQLQGEIAALLKQQQSLQNNLQTLQKQLGGLTPGGTNRGRSNAGSSGAGNSPSLSVPATQSSGTGTQNKTLDTVKLSDLATVTLAPPGDASINRTNGQPSVFVGVVKTEDANTVTMANAVNDKLNQLAKTLPAGIHIVPLFDSSTMIKASVNGMLREAILGAIFAVLVILLFLRNWRTTVIAVVSIPLSLLIAVIILNRLNITLNIMTLGGMAVATGRVVDDSIVVIENIFRNWRRGGGFGQSFVLQSTREVGQAITSSTITTVAVFLPLGFVSGVVGKIFEPFAVTVVCALLSSLLVALTVVPMLAWLFVARKPALIESPDALGGVSAGPSAGALGRPSASASTGASNGASTLPTLRPWQQRYHGVLRGALNHKAWVLVGTLVVFVASVAVLPLVGSTFIPASNEKFATVNITMPNSTPLSETNAKAAQVESVLKGYGSTIEQWNTKVGSDPGEINSSGGTSGSNQASLFLQLKPDTDVTSFIKNLRTKLVPVASPAKVVVKSLTLGGGTGGYQVTLSSTNQGDLKQAAQSVTSALSGMSGLANVSNNLAQTRPQVTIVPDHAKAAQYGLTPYQMAQVISGIVQGQNIGAAEVDGQSRQVWISVTPAKPLTSLDAIQNIELSTPVGQTVKLSDVASVSIQSTPVMVEHQNGDPFATISADFTTKNTGQTAKEAMAKIQALHLPSDVTVSVGGDTQEQNNSFSQLTEAILISVGLVYIVMLLAFGEWSAPFAILFSMPVALIGAFFGTVIGGQPISVSSLIGILMLMGIVVTNAIVLVDRVEQQRKRGLSIREALLEAGTTRLRPILMTAIATVCSLVPLAIGFAEGALISQGLAVVVIGGLISSTILTLVIVPVMYELLHFRTHRREQRGQLEERHGKSGEQQSRLEEQQGQSGWRQGESSEQHGRLEEQHGQSGWRHGHGGEDGAEHETEHGNEQGRGSQRSGDIRPRPIIE